MKDLILRVLLIYVSAKLVFGNQISLILNYHVNNPNDICEILYTYM